MKIKVSVLNVDKTFRELLETRTNLTKTQARVIVNKLKEDLINNTPIDTGLARRSWKVSEGRKDFNIENNVEYIEYLNQGSSKQAPSYFIETTALRYGTPLGQIVENKDN